MKKINMLNPYSFHYVYKSKQGKAYINSLINYILKENDTYNLLPFFNEKINNVRSFVILESDKNIVFLDFNFKQNDNLLKTNYSFYQNLRETKNKNVYQILINNFEGKYHEINNIYDIYSNTYNNKIFKYLYAKNYLLMYILNHKLTKTLYKMNDHDYKIYLHENILKSKI